MPKATTDAMPIEIEHDGQTVKVTELIGLYCRKPWPCNCTLTDRVFEERAELLALLHRVAPGAFARVVTDRAPFSLPRLVAEAIEGNQ